jgi:hypothetical protein
MILRYNKSGYCDLGKTAHKAAFATKPPTKRPSLQNRPQSGFPKGTTLTTEPDQLYQLKTE